MDQKISSFLSIEINPDLSSWSNLKSKYGQISIAIWIHCVSMLNSSKDGSLTEEFDSANWPAVKPVCSQFYCYLTAAFFRKINTSLPDRKWGNRELYLAATVKDSVLNMLTIIKAISHFANVVFLAPATSIFTRSVKISLLFPFFSFSGLKKMKQKSSQNLIIYKINFYSLHTMRSLWESYSSLLAEDPEGQVRPFIIQFINSSL